MRHRMNRPDTAIQRLANRSQLRVEITPVAKLQPVIDQEAACEWKIRIEREQLLEIADGFAVSLQSRIHRCAIVQRQRIVRPQPQRFGKTRDCIVFVIEPRQGNAASLPCGGVVACDLKSAIEFGGGVRIPFLPQQDEAAFDPQQRHSERAMLQRLGVIGP